ncbi:MAG TPA: Lrp/AsnC ligand binding domain-containing protein [Acidimicrobiales bacterium]|jgi:DNA-binding Lrp family transcriptional regulator|nr:Lrp/AsnC ligand binding domain-containing protein [Acidimicrobiales bacterium]
MSVHAYVLIQTDVGRAADVTRLVREIDGVVSAEDVTGPYDVIALLQSGSIDEVGRLVVSQVQRIDGITRTITCPVVHL